MFVKCETNEQNSDVVSKLHCFLTQMDGFYIGFMVFTEIRTRETAMSDI